MLRERTQMHSHLYKMSRKGETMRKKIHQWSLGLGVGINTDGPKYLLWGDINDLKLDYINGCTTM